MFIPTHGCLTSVLDAWQQNCPEIPLHGNGNRTPLLPTLLPPEYYTYCMCTVCMFFMFLTFHVCSIHRLDTWERFAFTHLETYF